MMYEHTHLHFRGGEVGSGRGSGDLLKGSRLVRAAPEMLEEAEGAGGGGGGMGQVLGPYTLKMSKQQPLLWPEVFRGVDAPSWAFERSSPSLDRRV